VKTTRAPIQVVQTLSEQLLNTPEKVKICFLHWH